MITESSYLGVLLQGDIQALWEFSFIQPYGIEKGYTNMNGLHRI